MARLFCTTKLGLLDLLSIIIFVIDSSSNFPNCVRVNVNKPVEFNNTIFSLFINLIKYILSCNTALLGASN